MDTVYLNFVNDYNNPELTTHDVRRLNKLNSKQYSKIRNLALTRKDIPMVRHMNRTNAKFYCEKNGVYEVIKNINGKKTFIGKFNDEGTAQKVVRECIKHNWEINKLKNFIKKYKIKPKNYSLVNNYYVIQKFINGQNIIFACIHHDKVSEETVEAIVKEFRKVDWNIKYKDSILKMFNL